MTRKDDTAISGEEHSFEEHLKEKDTSTSNKHVDKIHENVKIILLLL